MPRICPRSWCIYLTKIKSGKKHVLLLLRSGKRGVRQTPHHLYLNAKYCVPAANRRDQSWSLEGIDTGGTAITDSFRHRVLLASIRWASQFEWLRLGCLWRGMVVSHNPPCHHPRQLYVQTFLSVIDSCTWFLLVPVSRSSHGSH